MIILPSLQIISDKFPGKLSNTECYITRENIDYSDTTGMVGFFCFVLVLFFFFQSFPYSLPFLYTLEGIRNTCLHFCQCY